MERSTNSHARGRLDHSRLASSLMTPQPTCSSMQPRLLSCSVLQGASTASVLSDCAARRSSHPMHGSAAAAGWLCGWLAVTGSGGRRAPTNAREGFAAGLPSHIQLQPIRWPPRVASAAHISDQGAYRCEFLGHSDTAPATSAAPTSGASRHGNSPSLSFSCTHSTPRTDVLLVTPFAGFSCCDHAANERNRWRKNKQTELTCCALLGCL